MSDSHSCTTVTVPTSLIEWRKLDVHFGGAYKVWLLYESFFAEHGYTLFVRKEAGNYIAPPGLSPVRGPDEYHHWLPLDIVPERPYSFFRAQSGVQMAARSRNNTDVIIRLLTIGDEGHECLAVLRTLSAPDARVPENHTLPMIDELHTDGMTFGVFPFMRASAAVEYPWFETTRQLFDMVEQVLEGFTYMHERLIAHRDFNVGEIFINFGASLGCPTWIGPPTCQYVPIPFRSLFPVRYYINDFEHSVQFDPASDPAARLVTGLVVERYGYTIDDYAKPIPPEIRTGAPYCPFKADIFQFGDDAAVYYRFVEGVPKLLALFATMASENPNDRPSAAEALATVREIRMATPDAVLEQVPKDPSANYGPFPPDNCKCVTCKSTVRPRVPLRDIRQYIERYA